MRRDLRHNRRGWAWLLALALLTMTSISSASWQCLNGAPCPPDCPMLHSAETSSAVAVNAAAAPSHCSKCPDTGAKISRAAHICPKSRCVLSPSAEPVALPKTFPILRAVSVVPEAPLKVIAPVLAQPLIAPMERLCFPQHFLRPHFGRAPPTLLG